MKVVDPALASRRDRSTAALMPLSFSSSSKQMYTSGNLLQAPINTPSWLALYLVDVEDITQYPSWAALMASVIPSAMISLLRLRVIWVNIGCCRRVDTHGLFSPCRGSL